MVEQSLVDVSVGSVPGMTTMPHLHEFSVTGPVKVEGVSDTPSRRKIFSCRPAPGADEMPCAKQIVTALARQAWRRPVDANDLEALLNFYQAGRNRGRFRFRRADRHPSHPRQPRIRLPLRTRPARRRARPQLSHLPIWNSPRASPSSYGAARPTTSSSRSPPRTSLHDPDHARKAGPPHAGRSALGSADDAISPSNGCICRI